MVMLLYKIDFCCFVEWFFSISFTRHCDTIVSTSFAILLWNHKNNSGNSAVMKYYQLLQTQNEFINGKSSFDQLAWVSSSIYLPLYCICNDVPVVSTGTNPFRHLNINTIETARKLFTEFTEISSRRFLSSNNFFTMQ